MKFEEASLTEYLVKNLGPLTEANPVILAKYVVALLKKDKPVKELQKLCTENLVEFLGNGAKPFTTKLFQALEDGSIIKADVTLDAVQKSESSQAPIRDGVHPLKNLSPKEENLSTSSESSSDTEDKEASDDEDADRNHKHRRREAQPNSFETDTHEQFVRRPNKKRNKPYDNGQADIQTSGIHKEYNPNSGRNVSSKFDKRSNFTPLPQAPLDPGPRTRFNQPLHGGIGPHFDLSTSVGRPIGKGRGRSTVPWNQHDARFNPYDTLDFDSRMASQGPVHPRLFAGTGLPIAASAQSSSWGGFGFIPGMPNGIMDPLNPLGLQGALLPSINPPLNLAMPHQCCRDFEERGFCLRGDMCPMEHGLNRIVVEDVQSLSQFNLPVFIPCSHGLGIQAGSGSLPVVPAVSAQVANIKSISNKSTNSGVKDDAANRNDIPSASIGGDPDVYDPDQPLWNNDRSDASAALLRFPSPNIEDVPPWDGIESEDPNQRITGNTGSLNTSSSVWGRIGSSNKSGAGSKLHNMMKEDHEDAINNTHAFSHGKGTAKTEIDSKTTTIQPFSRSHADSGHKSGRAFHKALRTLYVNGVPQKSNRRDELILHFKKFGEVIDIYIPLNSEKAFVQFSKREEAEAALKSPDAVMGNRFIKLSWANHDRIPDEGQCSGHNTPVQSRIVVATSVPSKQTAANGGKGIVPISAQKSNSITASERPKCTKSLMSSSPKEVFPAQKKPESLELLEEIRRKQDSLAKKREEFKRQLEKFEKQAISSNKADVIPEAAKRQKVDAGTAANKAASPKNIGQVDVKASEKKLTEEVLCWNGLKALKQQSLKSTCQTSSLPASLPNRYKLDNRSTTFRVLPTLPAGFASVAVLKDHFSHYGVISSAVLEDPYQIENDGLYEKCSARITFATRHSAERAYQTGNCWDGHNLKFKWLTASQNISSDCTIQETSSSSPKQAQNADFQLNPVTSGSSSSGAEKSTFCVYSEVAAMKNVGTNGSTWGTDCPPISVHKSFAENSRCSPTISSCKELPDALIDEDHMNLSSAL